jgi:hypothetical protein
MHIFYASLQIAAVATSNSIGLIIYIPLKSESVTYGVSKAIPIPAFEPILNRHVKIGTASRLIAISSDKRSYMLIDIEYLGNCRKGFITLSQ